jgi:hypothetical protein
MTKHGWQINEKLIDCDLFKKIFTFINQLLNSIDSPSKYTPIQLWKIEKISEIIKEIETYYITDDRKFVTDGLFLIFCHMIRIHSSHFFNKDLTNYQKSVTILKNISSKIIYCFFNSFVGAKEGYEKEFQYKICGVDCRDILLNYHDKSCKSGLAVNGDMKTVGIHCGIMIALLHAHTDLSTKYQTILTTLKKEIEVNSSFILGWAMLVSISLLATTQTNRTVLYNNGFHSVVFNSLIKDYVDSNIMLFSSQALCNMTCEESSNLKNTILNAENFEKLKKLIDKIKDSSPQSAIVIENIFLSISNILIGNKEALTPITDTGFISMIINYLSPDTDNKQRQDAGNIANQQIAALRALHSISFHQTEHINVLIANNILSCVKVAMDSNKDDIYIKKAAISGILYNISSFKGYITYQNGGEIIVSYYLKEFEEEKLMKILSDSVNCDDDTVKNYSSLTIGQLYRNRRLKEEYRHIIPELKRLLKDSDADMSFKARNALEVLSENKGFLLFNYFKMY